MDIFLKATAGVLIALVMYLILAKQNKDFSLVLTVAVCCLVTGCVVSYMQPIIDFFSRLRGLAKLNTDMLKIILKSVGIALIGEMVNLICADAGNNALGKTLQILASVVILWMSVPLFSSLVDLAVEILGAI